MGHPSQEELDFQEGWPRGLAKEDDPIQPRHYSELSPEPLHVIEGWSLGFYAAQVVKYIARAGRKGGPGKLVEDLKKAAFYLNRWIYVLEKKDK